ncbi:MAG: CDP-glycerol glycerophosphotransferase family protein [Spirochaetia bacterium]|nr:CDP-glycerol glycerophosphotransferase family protein [Spirochaetia bacterium]
MNLFLPLYIDPGTGSMLFSILIGAAATLFFLGKAALIKIKLLFSAKKNGVATTDTNYKKYVVYNEGMQYWNVFKPVCDEFEKRQIELTYYTSAQNDPCFEQNYKFVKPEFIGEGNMAFVKLNMLSAGVVLMTTPGLQVYQLKRSKHVKHYAHVLHAASDATMYRLFGIDYFDSVLLSGDYQKKDIITLEKQRNIKAKELVTVGCPYLDTLNDKIQSIQKEENHNFTVLVSPSWGKSSLLTKYGEKLLDPLVKTNWNIIIRPHPQSKKSEPEILKRLEEMYKNCTNVSWDYERDNIYSMKKSDIMISDFSGIIYDYTFLCDKPVIYVNAHLDLRPYDAYDIDGGKNIWQFKTLKEIGIELDDSNFENIESIIKNATDSADLAEKRKKAKQEAWMHQSEAGKNIVEFMIQKATQQGE